MGLGSVASATGQSITLTDTRNSLTVSSSLGVAQSALAGVDLGMAFSIAGVLDIGFVYGRSLGSTEGTETDIGLSYALSPVKQRTGVPVSVQIYGEYAFRSVTSDFLTRNRLAREGEGYGMGILLARDLKVTPWFALRMGGVSEFTNYTETYELTFVYDPDTFVGEPDVDYGEYPITERETSLSYGPYAAVVGAFPGGFTMGLSLATLFGADGVILRPAIQAAFSR